MNIDPNWRNADIANGPGVRVTIFVAGCRIHCPHCFNKEVQDFKYGVEFTPEITESVLEACAPEHIAGLTILGGEPMEPENQRGLLPLVKAFKERYPNKTIWCFTGYLWDQDILREYGKRHIDITDSLIENFDYVVDGPFVEMLKDLSIAFRGSSNQRILEKQSTEVPGKFKWVDVSKKFDRH